MALWSSASIIDWFGGAYPNALKDVMAAVKWFLRTQPTGADPTQWYIGGESAGGLTLALTLAACERGGAVGTEI